MNFVGMMRVFWVCEVFSCGVRGINFCMKSVELFIDFGFDDEF